MTYYDILEVSKNASNEVIRMAYKALAKKYHPDVFQGDPKESEEIMKHINEAFAVLSDEKKRKQYDDSLRSKTNGTQAEDGASTPFSKRPKKDTKIKKDFKYPSGVKSTLIISLLLFVILCQPIGTYAENSNLFDYAILLGMVEFCAYCLIMMTAPALIGTINRNLTPKNIKLLCLINSVVVFGVSLLLYVCEVIPSMFIGWITAVFYYFINKHILLQLKKHSCNKKKSLITILIIFIVILSMVVGGIILAKNLLVSNTSSDNSSGIHDSSAQFSNNTNTLVVAIEDDFIPFSYKENGEYRGIHVDMATEMARRLNQDVTFVSAPIHELIDGVDKGRYDIAFGIEKNAEREDLVMFSEPYYKEMAAIFNGESFSEYSNYTTTLGNMIEDGTVNNIISRYAAYLSDSNTDTNYIIDDNDSDSELDAFSNEFWSALNEEKKKELLEEIQKETAKNSSKRIAVRTITLSDKSTADFVLGLMQGDYVNEEGIIKIMDQFGADQGGGKAHLIEPGIFVEEVDEWCFANNRVEGDMAIIKNVYGYSICYISEIFE